MQTSISCCMLAGGQVVRQVGQVRQVGRLAGEAGGQVGRGRSVAGCSRDGHEWAEGHVGGRGWWTL